jgi:hypothetical protein
LFIRVQSRAAEKQKMKERGSSSYKQATPLGFDFAAVEPINFTRTARFYRLAK